MDAVAAMVIADLGTRQLCTCGATLAGYWEKCAEKDTECEGLSEIIDSVKRARSQLGPITIPGEA